MIQRIKEGMAKPEVRAKLRILNARKRCPMNFRRRMTKSDEMAGKMPANMLRDDRPLYNGSRWGRITIDGRTYLMKSTWERNFARYLDWQKRAGQIFDWDYEPRTFVFSKRIIGARSLTPDFLVTYRDGSHFWFEVKGMEMGSFSTKLRLMRKEFPTEQITVVRTGDYRQLAIDMASRIPGWEPDLNLSRDRKRNGL